MENKKSKKQFHSLILKINKERFLYLLILSLTLGISVGVLQIKMQNSAIMDKLAPYLQNIVLISVSKNFWIIFLSELKLVLTLIILTVLCGFFTFGAPLTLITPFFYGIGYGAYTAFIYFLDGKESIFYNSLTVAIPFAICGFFLILSCNESARLSSILLRTIRSKKIENEDFKSELKLFIFRQSFFLLFIVITLIIKSAILTFI